MRADRVDTRANNCIRTTQHQQPYGYGLRPLDINLKLTIFLDLHRILSHFRSVCSTCASNNCYLYLDFNQVYKQYVEQIWCHVTFKNI